MKWIVAILVFLTAGYMLFDGVRALTVGDYITPGSGEHAGQLGAWAGLVSYIGFDPRSAFIKSIFVVYGLASLIALGAYLTNQPWGRGALMITALFGLWYLPIGTATNITVLILLFLQKR